MLWSEHDAQEHWNATMKQIKREMVLAAPVGKVWQHITDPNKIAGWLMPNDFKAEVGKEFSMTCDDQGRISCIVKEIVPEKKLVYSFQSKVTQIETLVTITLESEGENTRLTLIHSGWDRLLPGQEGTGKLFDDGWGKFLIKLQKQISSAETGSSPYGTKK
jgi:uncharacterized protein YndB with AHSA1/START domain